MKTIKETMAEWDKEQLLFGVKLGGCNKGMVSYGKLCEIIAEEAKYGSTFSDIQSLIHILLEGNFDSIEKWLDFIKDNFEGNELIVELYNER